MRYDRSMPPLTLASHLRTVATFNRTANEIVLAALRSRAEDPSALASCRHVFEAEMVWYRRLSGGDANVALFPVLGEYAMELAICADWLAEASFGLERYATELPEEAFGDDFTYHNLSGQPRSNLLANVLQHVFLHSAQYRGETLGKLAPTGPVPDIDYIFYVTGEARFGRL